MTLLGDVNPDVRDILDVLAQCNRPKPTLAYTSSLGFRCLYIRMLGFIVAQILYYTLT